MENTLQASVAASQVVAEAARAMTSAVRTFALHVSDSKPLTAYSARDASSQLLQIAHYVKEVSLFLQQTCAQQDAGREIPSNDLLAETFQAIFVHGATFLAVKTAFEKEHPNFAKVVALGAVAHATKDMSMIIGSISETAKEVAFAAQKQLSLIRVGHDLVGSALATLTCANFAEQVAMAIADAVRADFANNMAVVRNAFFASECALAEVKSYANIAFDCASKVESAIAKANGPRNYFLVKHETVEIISETEEEVDEAEEEEETEEEAEEDEIVLEDKEGDRLGMDEE